jgi:excisionase family DNA binding protein
MNNHPESGSGKDTDIIPVPTLRVETLGNGQLLTYTDLSKYLRRKESALRNDVMRKRIPYLKIGEGRRGQVRFRKKDIDAWLESKFTPAREE